MFLDIGQAGAECVDTDHVWEEEGVTVRLEQGGNTGHRPVEQWPVSGASVSSAHDNSLHSLLSPSTMISDH